MIDVAMPTKQSGDVIETTLDSLAAAGANADVDISQLVIVDDKSDDGTPALARACAIDYGWETSVVVASTTLPEARERAIDLVETEWFLFLDDDVRLREDYLARQLEAISPAVGAVQGRKASRDEHPSDWGRRRARRGGTHATLIRRDAVADISIPNEITVLEDEYLRRWVESGGCKWFLHPQARFAHACQDRHPIGWAEGYVGGKFGLQAFQDVALNVPFALATGRNPVPHAKRAAGWLAGRASATDPALPDAEVEPHV